MALFVSATTSLLLSPARDSSFAQTGAIVYQAIAKHCLASRSPKKRKLLQSSSALLFSDASSLELILEVGWVSIGDVNKYFKFYGNMCLWKRRI